MPELSPMPGLAIPVAAEATLRDEPVRSGAAIASVAMAVPEQVVANGPIADRLGIDEEWIVKRTGVRERRHARPPELLADFATEAGAAALARAGLDPPRLHLRPGAAVAPD